MTIHRLRGAAPLMGWMLLLAGCGAGGAQMPRASEPVPASASPRTAWVVPPTARPAPITAAEYGRRRDALAERMGDDGVLVVPGAPAPAHDYQLFFQEPNFRYLTGILEPGAALIVEKRGSDVRENLFVLPRDPAREIWEGERLGPEGAEALTGIPSHEADRFRPMLDSLLARHDTLYTTIALPSDPEETAGTLSPAQQVLVRAAARHPGVATLGLGRELGRLRARKSGAELNRIRRAVYITVLAQRAAMRSIEPAMNEFEVQALIEYTFRRNGADRPSFATIVGSGPNSTALHYNADDRFMRADDVVVMDIGASYRGYAADVTRTVPVDGTFSPEQREIYEIVLAAQKAAEAEAGPEATWRELNVAAVRVLAEGLARVGLIDSPDATYDCGGSENDDGCPQYRLFYMHGLGHGIGLDVHDPDIFVSRDSSRFRTGAAFTIEPGIYVRPDALEHLADTPANRAMIARLRPAVEQYRNIGVRIEDDYLVTDDGLERISAGAPREIAAIEALMREEAVTGATRREEVVEWYRALGRGVR